MSSPLIALLFVPYFGLASVDGPADGRRAQPALSLVGSSPALASAAPASGPTTRPAPAAPPNAVAPPTSSPTRATASPPSAPQPAPAQPAGSSGTAVQFAAPGAPPFAIEELSLADALRVALEQNIDLRARVVDVGVSEAAILSALGVFDVRLTAGIEGSNQRVPQRGSQFAISTGSRSLSTNLGLSRRLETGGTLSLRVDAVRTVTDQSRDFLNAAAGSVELASYAIRPSLQLNHPLLRGMGIRVNRAAIDRAKVATSQQQAAELDAAQNLVRDLIRAYWDVLFARRDLDNKQRSVELAQRQLDRTLVQVTAGRLAPVEAKSVEQNLASRESEVLLAENVLLDRSLTLRTLMGQGFVERDILGVMPSTDPANVRPELLDQRGLVQQAISANPAARQLELAIASARIDELEAANQRLPQLDFVGTFTPQGRSIDSLPDSPPGAPAERGSWAEAFGNFVNDDIAEDGLVADFTVTGALNLTWDIQNRTAKANHQRVQLELQRAELNLERIQQTIATSVLRAINNLRTAGKRMDVAQLSIELAEQNHAAEQARFEVGRSTNYDVLMRIDELAQSQAEALNAQIDYLKGLVELQALTGEILPAYGLDLSRYGG
ncbi:MAG: TolC family protein [Myxococcales bacterium FL481]|nr:MAG: TolC family protein [Myxococcales bacterium FL481]